VRRKVALKVLKPGMDSRRVVARFEAERQALALMDHPNIARVFDGGTTPGGRPYFVMELVRGIPLTAYCDQGRLTVRERLELFVSVCQAVQHAHQKGIIHRDLKPSNLLVTLHDGVPVAKVIDFGVAKALGQPLTDKTLYTGFAQLVGTPLYMSPEQAALSGLDVDTRSDIYSLGVVLYELLTGTTPFDRKRFLEAGYDEIRRIIREEEPPKPSTRISTLGEAATAVSAQRKSDSRRLRQFFRGELDWIVMKALEKDRNRRYETAGALAADVQHYLLDEPVLACPPSRGYRLRKLLRKHRAAVLTAAAFIGLLLAGVAVGTWQAVRATRAEGVAEARRVQAEAAEKKARAVNEFLIQEMIGAADPEEARGRKVTVEEVLDNAAKKVGDTFAEQPDVEASVRQAIGDAYNGLGLYSKAEPHLLRALELRQRILGDEDPDTLDVMQDVGEVKMNLGQYREGEAVFRKTLEGLRRVHGDEDPRTLDLVHEVAYAAEHLGRWPEAEKFYRQALEGKRRVLGPERDETLRSMGKLSTVLAHEAQYDEAERLARDCLAIRLRVSGADAPMTLQARSYVVYALVFRRKAAEAVDVSRENLEAGRRIWGPKHPVTLMYAFDHAVSLFYDDQLDEAERVVRQDLQDWLDTPRADPARVADCQKLLGLVLSSRGRWAEAETLVQQGLEADRRVKGAEHPYTYRAVLSLGVILQSSGKRAEAGPLLRAAVDGLRAVLPANHPYLADSLYGWAEYLLEEGDIHQAEAALREALEIQRRYPDRRDIGPTLAALGWALTRDGRARAGEPLLSEGADVCRKRFPEGHWVTADADSRLGACLTELRRFDQAEHLLLDGYRRVHAAPGAPPLRTRQALDRIIALYEAWGKPDKAAEWRQKLETERKTENKPAP
jgi:tetratricopeptide (TPR) repeat protein